MRAILIAIALVVAVTGCNTRTHQLVTTLNRTEQQPPRIVLMPLDVELSLLSAAGMNLAPRGILRCELRTAGGEA